MTDLSINLNKIALIRNSREGNYPDVVEFAKVCIDQGADGITVHPRPDQRHIRPDDVRRLATLVKPLANVEFNVEGNPFAPAIGDYPGFIELVAETMPDQCTLVPDGDGQLTSDHGFDLEAEAARLAPLVAAYRATGARVAHPTRAVGIEVASTATDRVAARRVAAKHGAAGIAAGVHRWGCV